MKPLIFNYLFKGIEKKILETENQLIIVNDNDNVRKIDVFDIDFKTSSIKKMNEKSDTSESFLEICLKKDLNGIHLRVYC
jgi:hypothetical protein